MDAFQTYDLDAQDGTSDFSFKIDGNTIVLSQFILEDLVMLRVKPGFDDKIDAVKEQIAKSSEGFSRKAIVILPSWVDVLKPIPSAPHVVKRPCPQCGGTMRQLGKDQMVCLACGHEGTRTQDHLKRVVGESGSGGIRIL